jgi:hypothetical protein
MAQEKHSEFVDGRKSRSKSMSRAKARFGDLRGQPNPSDEFRLWQ